MAEQKTSPYGTWKSPITADLIAKSSTAFDELIVDTASPNPETGIYHIERRPHEGGRCVLVHTQSKTDVLSAEKNSDGTYKWNCRTGVQEYGGAASVVHDDVVYFSNFGDGRLYRTTRTKEGVFGEPIAVTPENSTFRFANIAVHPKNPCFLVCILEDHAEPAPQDVKTSLAVISVDSSSGTAISVISIVPARADVFYSSPIFNCDGTRLSWVTWSHPDMPWDGSEVWVADIAINVSKFELLNARSIAGEHSKVSAGYPTWLFDDAEGLLFSSDQLTGYQNPSVARLSPSGDSTTPLLPAPMAFDFSEPAWKLGGSTFTALSKDALLFSILRDGRSELCFIGLKSNGGKVSLRQLGSPYVQISCLRPLIAPSAALPNPFDNGSTTLKAAFIGSLADGSPELVLMSIIFDGPEIEAHFESLLSVEDPTESQFKPYFSFPRALSINAGMDDEKEQLHVVYYPPKNPEYASTAGKDGEKPPCIVSIHGGPTSISMQGLKMRVQYFTSRGWAWVDVNYGGSSGYGRKYVERLDGKWGIIDVADAIQTVRELGWQGLIDAKRAVLTGGSAGGYTVLQALCAEDEKDQVFAAGTSSYGISNLFTLAKDTHKFELKYMEKLLGGTPEDIPDVYEARSPVFHADRVKVPLLILQGSIDAVVPPAQAEDMIKVIRERGGRVQYKLYEGEGHGWRRVETIADALETERAFYEDVLSLKASD